MSTHADAAPGGASTHTPEALRAALDGAREELLTVLGSLTERDFATRLAEGVTIVSLLADLAAAEHDAIGVARAAIGLAPRPRGTAGAASARPLPPQVTHALAGTRHEVRLLLDSLPARTPVDPAVARALLEGVAGAELDAATRISARPSPDDTPPLELRTL